MAITTLDGALAGMQPVRFFHKAVCLNDFTGRPWSWWGAAGIPGAGAYDTTLNGVTLSAPVAGAIPFTNPASGNTYLTRLMGSLSGGAGGLYLCDRLWHNGGINITSTSAQSITTPTWPARDRNGSTNGDGVFIACEVSSQTGANTPTMTISYTNSAGTSGRSATASMDTPSASSKVGSFFRFRLQAGDVGVRSVQSLTLSASWTSGTINLVAYRIIGHCDCAAQYSSNGAVDLITGGFQRIYNDSVLFPVGIGQIASASRIGGAVQWTQG